MKTNKLNYIILLLMIMSFSCSKEDAETSQIVIEEVESYSMTAKINGVLYEMNNRLGTNTSIKTYFSYYPNDDYIQLQGSYIKTSDGPEINIWIHRNDLKPGTYFVGLFTDTITTHVDLIYPANDTLGNPIFENTVSGSITITSVDATENIVKGTFKFETIAGDSETDPINFKVTEGTFNYKYQFFN